MAKDFSPKPPDYTVSAMRVDGPKLGRIGAGWITPEGRIRVKIDDNIKKIVLDTRIKFMLFPYVPKGGQQYDQHDVPFGVPAEQPTKRQSKRKYEELVNLGSAYADSEERVWTEDPTPQGPYQIG